MTSGRLENVLTAFLNSTNPWDKFISSQCCNFELNIETLAVLVSSIIPDDSDDGIASRDSCSTVLWKLWYETRFPVPSSVLEALRALLWKKWNWYNYKMPAQVTRNSLYRKLKHALSTYSWFSSSAVQSAFRFLTLLYGVVLFELTLNSMLSLAIVILFIYLLSMK